jgi:DNA-binding response OmpR family regulator
LEGQKPSHYRGAGEDPPRAVKNAHCAVLKKGRLTVPDARARVLVLSMRDDEAHVTRALQAGASGYVTKNAPPEELLEAIRRVAAGRIYIEREVAEGLAFASVRSSPHPLKDLSSRDLESGIAIGDPSINFSFRSSDPGGSQM